MIWEHRCLNEVGNESHKAMEMAVWNVDFIYFASSTSMCFSVFSFCLTYCVWGLLFAGCRFVVPVVFGVCPHWPRLVQWLV